MGIEQLAAAMAAERAPQVIPPQPVPMMVNIDQVVSPKGETLIQVAISHPVGLSVFFLEPHLARKIGAELQRLGSAGTLLVAQPAE